MDLNNKKIALCLLGPTASGKTDLAIDIARYKALDIISVDSAMIYKDMNIGTGKPTVETLQQVPHLLIDIRKPTESYSVADFYNDAIQEMENIYAKGRIPLLVGGTMMYFQALFFGIDDLPTADKAIREKLSQEAKEFGWQELHRRLMLLDPTIGAKIHPNDPQRLQRALEVIEITGQPMSELWQQNKANTIAGWGFKKIAILPNERSILHARIALRFQLMLKAGLIEEVEKLIDNYQLSASLPSMRCVGYRQIYQYLNGEIGKEQMIEKAIAATRQLAKRQLTWLRRWSDINFFDSQDPQLLKKICGLL